MKFQKFFIYGLKDSSFRYILGKRGKLIHFLYYQPAKNARWLKYPTKNPGGPKYSFADSDGDWKKNIKEISEEEFFSEVL